MAGIVVARQRPGTANGIVFMLLEDEAARSTSSSPPPVYERCRAAVRAAPLVRAVGRLERHEGTTNVVVSEVAELASQPARRPVERPAARRSAPPPRRSHLREHAVAELRAVAPRCAQFGPPP